MITKKLENIEVADLDSLVQNNVQENKSLEYKAELPGNTYDSKKEFLADISSLANTDGGDMLFGVQEADGVPQANFGISIPSVDAEIARLENIIREGVSPRFSVQIRDIEIEGGKHVLIVRTKASLEGPHRVTLGGHDKFYKRNSNGKYSMDVGELRTAFVQASELVERIKRFRIGRVGDIKIGDTPFLLRSSSSFLALHIVPLSAFSSSFQLDSATLLSLQTAQYSSIFQPISASGWNHRINLDGVTAYTPLASESSIRTYTQLYRDGRIETVLSDVFTENKLPMGYVEPRVMEHTKKMLQLLGSLEFQPPFYVFLSLVGVEGCTVTLPSNNVFDETEPIIQKELILPEIVIEDVGGDIQQAFKPIFDMIWNASGMSRSLNYDENGQYRSRI